MDDTRRERLSKRIIHELSDLLMAGEIKDPRVSRLVSFSYCKLAKDGTSARIGVSSIIDDSELKMAVDGLNSAAGFIQHHLGRSLKTRTTPKIHFVEDHSIEDGQRVITQLNNLARRDDA